MAESDDHQEEMVSAKLAIRDHLRHRRDAYVASNLLIYYEEGNPKACTAPDVFVVLGVEKKRRRVYKLWEEGKAPCFVLEVTSRSTRLEDLGEKRAVYAMLGVAEYFLFDPWGDYLAPPLQGYRLRHPDYERIKAGPGGVLECKKLGLRLVPEPGHLRLVDSRTGRSLLTPDQGLEAAREEAARAEQEAARAEREAARAEKEAAARARAEELVLALKAKLRDAPRARKPRRA